MPSGVRVPLPWESDQNLRKVVTDLAPVVDNQESTELRAARRYCNGLLEDEDPNKRRRGATGAANWVYSWMTDNGINTTREAVRDRVNQARRVTAAKRHR